MYFTRALGFEASQSVIFWRSALQILRYVPGMIYLLGMSHIMPVLCACSTDPEKAWSAFGEIIRDKAPHFFEWPTAEDILPCAVKVASIYIAHVAPYWGPTLAMESDDSGLGCSPQFGELLKSIPQADSADSLFVFMHGEEFIHICRRAYSDAYDFYLPERPDLSIRAGRQIIPLEVIQRQMREYLSKAIATFKVIRAFKPEFRIINVICPPPVDGEVLENSHASFGGSRVDEDLRLKHYLVYQAMLQEATAALRIQSLPPPKEALTSKGLLSADYTADPVHGNAKYGAQVLRQMRQLLANSQ